MKVTKEQIAEWKQKYGKIYQLECEGKTAIVFDPLAKLHIIKSYMHALIHASSVDAVDVLLKNCWLAGDESIKSDDALKLGLVDQVNELIDMPDFDVEFDDKEKTATITVEGKSCKVNLATRQDVKYAEDRNKTNKVLDTNIFLLERIAIDDLKEWRTNTRLYIGLLRGMDKVKDRKYADIKKL